MRAIKRQFEIEDLGAREARILLLQFAADEGIEVKGLVSGEAHYRRQHGLLIDRARIVGFAIKMNGEAGNNGERTLAIDQHTAQGAALVTQSHAPGERQIAIKPGIQ